MRIPGRWLRWKPGVSECAAISLERVDGSFENGTDRQMQMGNERQYNKRNEIAQPTRVL